MENSTYMAVAGRGATAARRLDVHISIRKTMVLGRLSSMEWCDNNLRWMRANVLLAMKHVDTLRRNADVQ